ncbi:MAG: hypothetical protein AAF844_09680 [Pseudomonadota bacterium]
MRPAADIRDLRRAVRELQAALGPLAPLGAPIAAISVLGLALSMGLPLFALLMDRADHSGTVIGLNTMAAPLAMVLSSPLMPRIMAFVGLARLAMLATGTLAAMFLVIPMVDGLVAWTLLRLVWGPVRPRFSSPQSSGSWRQRRRPRAGGSSRSMPSRSRAPSCSGRWCCW